VLHTGLNMGQCPMDLTGLVYDLVRVGSSGLVLLR